MIESAILLFLVLFALGAFCGFAKGLIAPLLPRRPKSSKKDGYTYDPDRLAGPKGRLP